MTTHPLVKNPGFEEGLHGWTHWGNVHIVSSPVAGGERAARIGPDAGGAGQVIGGVSPGERYTLFAKGAVSGRGERAYIGVDCLDADGNKLPQGKFEIVFNKTVYAHHNVSFTTVPNTASLQVYIWKNAANNNGGYAYADDIALIHLNPYVEKAMFNDFHYDHSTDPLIEEHNWSIRSYAGGPGPDGVTWSRDNVAFLDDPTNCHNRLLRLTAVTDGTGAGTSQAQVYTSERKFFEGTYAARVRLTNEPISGMSGDGIVETFYTISPFRYDQDPLYSELDFEYLANGGWGVAQAAMWNTSWYTYTVSPWSADSQNTTTVGDWSGWRQLVMVVYNNEVNYYMDGELLATHGGKYYPRQAMSINFNLWFLPEQFVASSGTRMYEMDVDWVYHAKDVALTPAEVNRIVQNHRIAGVTFTDNIK